MWVEDPFAFEPIAVRCHGCYLMELAQKDVPTGDTATQVILVPPATAKRMREAPRRKPERRRERVLA